MIEDEEVRDEIEKCKKELRCLQLSSYRDQLNNVKIDVVHNIRKILNIEKNAMPKQENVVLQGACYILSTNFINKMDTLFYPMDSFYFEEHFLFRQCVYKQIKTVYDPMIMVIHNESSATNYSQQTMLQKKEFRLRNVIESMKLYLKKESREW